MSQLETIMLVALGFVIAALVAMFIGRMVWSYGVNLGKRRTERSAPATIAGLQAERDQLRAEAAMQARKLELRHDDLKTRLAEQTAEVSRNRNRIDHLVKEVTKRDEVISERDGQIEQLNQHVEPLEAELAARTQVMQQLKEQLRDRDDEQSSIGETRHRTEIAERDDEIARLHKEMANSEARQQEFSKEAESAQERLQNQIHELTNLSGQIEKQRSGISEQFGQTPKPQTALAKLAAQTAKSLKSSKTDRVDDEVESQKPSQARIKAAISTQPAVKEKKPASGSAKSTAKKTKPSTARSKKPTEPAKKAKPAAKKTKAAAKLATKSVTKPSAKKAKTTNKTVAKAEPETTRPADEAIRSETESAKFASEAIKAAARKPKSATRHFIQSPEPAAENAGQGSILAAMRKKSIGLSGNSPDSISRAGASSRKADDDVNAKIAKNRDLERQSLDEEPDADQLQNELEQLDAVWAKKIAALNKAAPKLPSIRDRAETAEKALSMAEPDEEPDSNDDQPAASRSRQNVISLAARIRSLQKKNTGN